MGRIVQVGRGVQDCLDGQVCPGRQECPGGQRCPDSSVSSALLTYRVNFHLFKNRDLEPEEFYLLLPLMKAVLVA